MDKFDLQIAMLKPSTNPAKLDERQFMKKLSVTRRAIKVRRMLAALMVLAGLAIVWGAMRRNIWDVFGLTVRYFSEIPTLFSEYAGAYLATISWPSIISLLLLSVLGIVLYRSRKDATSILSKRVYGPAMALGVLAFVMGAAGIYMSPSRAAAQQDALRRGLNEQGHLEVQVGGQAYELNAKSSASDASIRSQAFIEELRNFDISRAYPELKDMNHDGFVAEVRAVNDKDDCIYYVERRLEPAMNQVMDANAGCIRKADQFPTYYLSPQLKPVKAPRWKVGQAAYFSFAQKQEATQPHRDTVGIVILLDGKADEYVAARNEEKVVPKGQPSGGVQACGIAMRETCPQVGYVDIFTNAEGHASSGDSGSSVLGDSFRPRSGSEMTRMFGRIIAMTNQSLQLESTSGTKMTIAWPQNIVQQFNAKGAKNYQLATGPLQVEVGDHLVVDISYGDGMDLQKLQISDVRFMGIALKTGLPDPLKNEPYDKNRLPEKY